MFLFNKSEHLQIVPTYKLLFQTWVTLLATLSTAKSILNL